MAMRVRVQAREAGSRVGRVEPEPEPEPRRTAPGLVARLLRGRSGRTGPAGPGPAATTGHAPFCRVCDQAVQPVVRTFWPKAALALAVAQLVAVIVSVVACFT